MIRTDVVVATMEALLLDLNPKWALIELLNCGPVTVMVTSSKWSAL